MTSESKTILVTGSTGFVGQHLLMALRRAPGKLVGTARDIRSASPEGAVPDQFERCDLRLAKNVYALLEKVQPDEIYHLAGQAEVAASWADPSATFTTNVDAQIILLESLRKLALKPRIVIVGSSEEYGLVHPQELPVNEENRLRPLSPYAVSKIAQDLMAYQYFRSYGFPILRTRAFNHTGPGRPPAYAVSGWAKQLAAIELGQQPPVLQVGNLEAKRDYLDVRDVVRAYILTMSHGEPGEVYNVCSGKAWRMGDILSRLLALSKTAVSVIQDPARLRPSDIPEIYGDPTKFQSLTGWAPEIPLDITLQDLLDYWRNRLQHERADAPVARS